MSTSANYLQRGTALLRTREFGGALRAFERHLDAHPRSVPGWVGASYALLCLRRVDVALTACERALALVPEYHAALALRERIATAMSHADATAAEGEISLDLGELLPALIELLGVVLF